MASRISKTVIILIAVLAVLAAAAAAGLTVVNRMIGAEISSQLDSSLKNSGLSEMIRYEGLRANAESGKITFTDITVNIPGTGMIQAENAYIKVSPMEALAIVRGTSDPEFSRVELGLKEASSSFPGTGFSVSLGSLSMSAEGELSRELAEKDLSGMLENLSSFSMKLEDSRVSLDDGLKMNLQAFAPVEESAMDRFLGIDSMNIDAELENDKIDIKKLSLDSGALNMKGSMTALLEGNPESPGISGNMDFSNLDPLLAEALSPFAEVMNQAIPESGNFQLIFSLDGEGIREFVIR